MVAPETYNAESDPIDLPTPTCGGKEFLGWTGSNGNSPQLLVSIPTGSVGDREYCANWNIGRYVVHFNPNGGVGEMEDQTMFQDTYQKLSQNLFTNSIEVAFIGNGGTPSGASIPSYREFQGWAESPEGDKVYGNNQNVRNLTDGSEITLYAKWGSLAPIYLPNATRRGYTFDNWHTEAVGGTEIGGDASAYTPTEPITLYAHWIVNNYIVTFDPTGGTLSEENTKEVTFDQPYGELPTPTHEEYAFTGWFTSSDGGY